jgi:linoleate 10R-lipoxygenase
VNTASFARGISSENSAGLNPQYCGLWREAVATAVIPQGPGLPPIEVKPGDRVWGSFKNAHLNVRSTLLGKSIRLIRYSQPLEFPNPKTVDPHRPIASYNLNGVGFHACIGLTFVEQTITEIIKVIFRLKNVRRAPGNAGRLAEFKTIINETETNMYLTPFGTTSPWPGSMYLVVSDLYFHVDYPLIICAVRRLRLLAICLARKRCKCRKDPISSHGVSAG